MRAIRGVAALLTAVLLLVPATAMAASPFSGSKDAACKGINFDGTTAASCAEGVGDAKINTTLGRAINLFSAIIGIIAVVMIMIGGIKYMTSQGDPNQATAARNTILYAAIGIVVAVLAQVIVRFVLKRFTG